MLAESQDGLCDEAAPPPEIPWLEPEMILRSAEAEVSVEDLESVEICDWTVGGGGAAPFVPDFFFRRPKSFLGRVPIGL